MVICNRLLFAAGLSKIEEAVRNLQKRLVAAAFAMVASGLAAQAEDAGNWRALSASMRDDQFTTTFTSRKPTREAALAALQDQCVNDGKFCTLVMTFNAGCRYVTIGGRMLAPKTYAPVYVVASSPDEASASCRGMNLECIHTPRGGCAD